MASAGMTCPYDRCPMNLYAILQQRFMHRQEHPALVVPGGATWTYGDLDRRAAAYAGAFSDAGLSPGDRVVVQVPKSLENVAMYLGALRSGVVFVTLNTAYTAAEVQYFIDDAAPKMFVGAFTSEFPSPPVGASAPMIMLTMGDDGSGTMSDAADAATITDEIAAVDDDDPATMLYTSGTTGRSKGAVTSHHGLASNAMALHDIWRFGPDDVLLHGLPIFHVHGLFVAMHCAMLSASTMIFLPRFDVDQVVKHLPQSTVMMGVPTHYIRLLDDKRFDSALCPAIRLFTSGSAPMTEIVHEQFEDRSGHRIVERYGMTEAGIITSNPYDGDRLAGTVGYALPGFELRVCDDDGNALAPAETGTVEIQGPGLFSGYWNKPDKTEEAYHGSWFITGDVGSLSDDGRLTLEGRSSDMIISGGYNVYPKEVELLLDELPGVVESAVVGLPHPDFGEAVAAFIVGDPDEPAIRAEVDSQLANFKRPKAYVGLDALPRNTMGKVQKNLLRTEYTNMFNGPNTGDQP